MSMTVTIVRMASRLRLLIATTLLLVVAPRELSAQLRTSRVVALEGAQRAVTAALAEAVARQWQVSIAVVDPAGELIAFVRMDGAPMASVDIARAKARTAARLRRPTKTLDSTLTAGRLPLLGLEGITPVEGGVPILVNGEILGAVGVSGATSAQDAQVAAAGAAAVRP